jgi:hypothetical protein
VVTPYAKSFDLYTAGETLDVWKLIAQVQADPALTQALCSVVIDATARTVTYNYAAALDQTQQDALDDCVAAYVYETLADAKARCIADCRTYRREQCEVATVEHPSSSGKYWSASPDFRRYLTMLVTDDVGAITLRTADGLTDHDFADTAAVAALLGVVAAAVNTEAGSCDTAIENICNATDVPAVEAARDAYVGA